MRKHYYKTETRATYKEIRRIAPELKKIEAARKYLKGLAGKLLSKII